MMKVALTLFIFIPVYFLNAMEDYKQHFQNTELQSQLSKYDRICRKFNLDSLDAGSLKILEGFADIIGQVDFKNDLDYTAYAIGIALNFTGRPNDSRLGTMLSLNYSFFKSAGRTFTSLDGQPLIFALIEKGKGKSIDDLVKFDKDILLYKNKDGLTPLEYFEKKRAERGARLSKSYEKIGKILNNLHILETENSLKRKSLSLKRKSLSLENKGESYKRPSMAIIDLLN